MDYSITQAAAATGRSPDSVRRAIRAGKLEATKLDAGYSITATDLEAWAGRPLISSADQATELKAARATIEAQAADLEAQAADLEAALDDLRKAKHQLDSAAEIIETQRDALTLARESATVLGATVAALNTRLAALPPGKTRRPWFRQRSTENRPPAEH